MVRATRNRKPTNYALDPYKDLDSSASSPALPADSSEDDDFLLKNTAAANVPSSPSSEDDDPKDTDHPRSTTALEPPSEGARIHRPHQFRVGRLPGAPPGVRRRDRIAKADPDRSPEADIPAALRPPDPSVKITYRPGFIKSTGKRERIVTAYGANIETLVKAVRVRDQFIGLPAVPEKSCLGFTPFWRKGQDVTVDVGMGRQECRRIEYYDAPAAAAGEENHVEKYLPAETGFQIKCIIGPSTGKKIITFQRFGMHDLAGSGKGKKGFILNAGGHVLGMDWAPNRPEGMFFG